MGIIVEPPDLEDAVTYVVHFDIYNNFVIGDGCGAPWSGAGFCEKTGAEIEAWFAAGNECVTGSGLCGANPFNAEKISSIETL